MMIQSMLIQQRKQIQSGFTKDQSPTHCNVDNARHAEINSSSIEFRYLEVQKILSGLNANESFGLDNLGFLHIFSKNVQTF